MVQNGARVVRRGFESMVGIHPGILWADALEGAWVVRQRLPLAAGRCARVPLPLRWCSIKWVLRFLASS